MRKILVISLLLLFGHFYTIAPIVHRVFQIENDQVVDSLGMLDSSEGKSLVPSVFVSSFSGLGVRRPATTSSPVEREREKASRDSLIAEKIAALDAVQADLNALEAEASVGPDGPD